jgi:hypothetical protein
MTEVHFAIFRAYLYVIVLKRNIMNAKFFLSVVAGAVTNFLLGWIVYGYLLRGFAEANMTQYPGLMPEMPNIFTLLLAILFMAFLIAFIFQRWAGYSTFMNGLYGGMIIGFFIGASIDLSMFSMMNLFTPVYMIVDILMSTIMTGIMGGVIAAVLGMGKKKETA